MSRKVISEEKLINYVMKYEVLYNNGLKDYSDNNYKLKIWNKIAKDCGFTSGEEAKKHWKNLRDRYRSALKMYRQSKRNGCPTNEIRTWKYFDKMNFIQPFMKERRSRDYLNAETSQDSQLFEENSEHSDNFVMKEEPNPLEISDMNEAETEGGSQLEAISSSEKTGILTCKSDLEELSGDMLWNQSEHFRVPEDSLKLFFDSMYASTKKLSPALQRAVKNKLFQAVNEAETEMEANQQGES